MLRQGDVISAEVFSHFGGTVIVGADKAIELAPDTARILHAG